jgi:hypothetical protein
MRFSHPDLNVIVKLTPRCPESRLKRNALAPGLLGEEL